MKDKKKCKLLSDVPVGEGSRGDDLDFTSYAEVLASAAIDTEDTITIGIFGGWGTGKTSLMRLIKKEVEKYEGVAAIWFNAWQYEKEEHLIISLMATIHKGLKRDWPEKFKNGAAEMGKAFLAVISAISGKVTFGIPDLVSAEVSVTPKETIGRIEKDAEKDSETEQTLYFNAFEELAKYAGKSNTPRIVVFVDDLDRCFPPKAVELLEGIKLVLNQKGFAFVLGVNADIIEAFIKTKYTKDFNIKETYFEDYLDKIVQVRIPVPVREPDEMNNYIYGLLNKGEVFPVEERQCTIPLIAEAGYRNPRKIVRLLNRVIVSSRIVKEREPLALLLNIAMDEPRYQYLRAVLDVSITFEDVTTPLTIGKYLATKINDHKGGHVELIGALRDTKLKSRQGELNKAIETLEKYEYLCNLLKSQPGMMWLENKEFRDMPGKSDKSLLEDEKNKGVKKDNTQSNLENPIDKLLNNMIRIPAGEFNMGSEVVENEKPLHKVKLVSFDIGAMPVTQAQYESIMKNNPSAFKYPDSPVENVSWDDAMVFCEKLSKETGETFILPSEAQWEYACRAGSDAKYCFGNSDIALGDYGWYSSNSEGMTHPVMRKKPNNWGLYDMHGNVWEWCLDHWHDNYEGAPNDGSPWYFEVGLNRVSRGGGWNYDAEYCRSSYRSIDNPSTRAFSLGFRIARKL